MKPSDELKVQYKEKLHYTLICQTANQIQKKIFDLKSQLSNTKRPANVKLVNPSAEKKFVGEIIMPCEFSKGKVIDLSVSYDELKELLRYI